MFFKKKPNPTIYQRRYVACEVCKHVVEREDAHLVSTQSKVAYTYDTYYCPEHRLPYDIVRRGYGTTQYFKKLVEVSEKGTIIKKK